MNEHENQNRIRVALSPYGSFFRVNVGQGWVGDSHQMITRTGLMTVVAGSIVLTNARPFDTGLPPGFSDLTGVVPTYVTYNMVGKTLGQAAFIEVKRPGGRGPTPAQEQFLAVMRSRGALAGVAFSPDDAVKIILPWEYHGDV